MGCFRFSRETRADESVGPGYPTRAGSTLPKEAAVPGGTVPTHTTPVPTSAPEPKQAGHSTPPHRDRGRCTFAWHILPEFPESTRTALFRGRHGCFWCGKNSLERGLWKGGVPLSPSRTKQVFCSSCCFYCPRLSCILNEYPLRS